MASRLSIAGGTAERIAVRCWGDFGLVDTATGSDLRPRGRKARAVIAYLAMHPDKPVGRAKLMGLLWSERAEDQARASLRQTLFEMRDLTQSDCALVRVERDVVTLDGSRIATDIEGLRVSCEAGDYDAILAALPDTDDTLFANLDGIDPGFDDWLRVERTRQHDALMTLVADASAGAIAAGKTRTARALHTRLVELGPDEIGPAPSYANAITPLPPNPAPLCDPLIGRRAMLGASSLLLASAIGGTIWWRSGDTASARTPSREVRGLYDQAKTIIYERDRSGYKTATSLLRRALVLEPDFPPALTSLASVTAMTENTPEGLAEAERLARRAIALDPTLAEAHGTLGMVLGFKSTEAKRAIKRAAALDPRDSQIQYWLSHVLAADGDYGGRLQALRRSVAADPQWARAAGTAALAAWELGFREEADGYAARLRTIDLRRSFNCAYAVDWARGDYSNAVRDTLTARQQLALADAADWKLGIGLLVLGHERPARLLMRLPPPLWRVASDAGPAPGELEPLLIGAERNERADFFVLTAMRQALRDGRHAEIVSAHDRKIGRLAELASDDVPNGVSIIDGLQVAIALRAVGREREATALLNRGDAAIRRSLDFGVVPNWMHASAAAVWATQGRTEEAVAALTTALNRGWHYSPMTPLPDMADIASFASLRGDARFEALRQRQRDHVMRERRELGSVPV